MSHRLDTLEASLNTTAGYVIAYLVSLIVFPLVGVETDVVSAGVITAIMAAVSFLRNYTFRRFFRWVERQPRFPCRFCGRAFYSYINRTTLESSSH